MFNTKQQIVSVVDCTTRFLDVTSIRRSFATMCLSPYCRHMSLVHQMFDQQQKNSTMRLLMLSKRTSPASVSRPSVKVKTFFCLFKLHQHQMTLRDTTKKKPEKYFIHTFLDGRGPGASKGLCWLRECEISFMEITGWAGNTTKQKFIKYLPFSNVAEQWLWNWRKCFSPALHSRVIRRMLANT